MKQFAKYVSLAVGILALFVVAAPTAEAAWTQITNEGLRTSDRSGKPGHFQFFSESEIYGMGGNGAIYLWGAGKTLTSPWEETDRKTADSATDHFFVDSAKQIYGLGNNGAVYRNEPSNKSWLHQITSDGARTTTDRGGPGIFQMFGEGQVYGLGQDGALYRTDGGQAWSVNVAGGGIVDHFYVTPDSDGRQIYGLGANGGIFKWNAGQNRWDEVTPNDLRTITNGGKAGYFQWASATKFYGLGGDGNVYVWESPATSWTKITDQYGVVNDAFHVTSAGVVYGLAGNGAVYRWDQPSATPYLLSVFKTGNGTVTSVPSGITCGSDCSESYAAGTNVTLTATADAGYIFTGWSQGECSGTGTCTLTMSAAKSVTATFSSPSTFDFSLSAPTATLTQGGPSQTIYVTVTNTSTATAANVSVTLDTTTLSSGVTVETPNGSCTPSATGTKTCTIPFVLFVSATASLVTNDSVSLSGTSGSLTHTGTFLVTVSSSGTTPPPPPPPSTPTIFPPLSPSSGIVGSLVTIAGTGFATASDAIKNTINFGATALSNLVASSTTSFIFSVPSVTPGTYNVSVTNANGTSGTLPFTVTTVSTTGLIVTLTPTPTSVNPGQTITVSWIVNQGTAQIQTLDWIGLFTSGAGNTAYNDFKYISADTDANPCSASNIGGCTAGTMTFIAPTTPGSYQFRYLPRNSYVDVGRSVAVLVQGSTAGVPTLTFTASPTVITTNQPSTLTWSFSDSAGSCVFGRGGTVTQSGVQKAWSSLSGASGIVTAAPLVTTGYDLSCTGTGGTVSKSVDIVVTPSVSIQQCDTAAAAAKISQATAQLSACIAGDAAACALASSLLAEATAMLSACATVSPPGVTPPGSLLSDGMAVKANAAIYVRSSPEISSTNKLNGNRPLPIGALGTIDCSPENLADGVTAPESGVNCPTIANGYIWWYVTWDLYDDGWSAEQAPGFSGLIIPATTTSTPPPPPSPISGTTPPPPPPPAGVTPPPAGSITANISASATTPPIGTPVTLTWNSTASGTAVVFCNVGVVVASSIGGGSSLLLVGGVSGSTSYTLVDPGTKTFNVTCGDGLGVSDTDSVSVTWQSPTSSTDREATLRRGLAQVEAGVAEVTKSIEQLLKNLGR